MSTTTNRIRGRRLAVAILAAAALSVGATACGPDDGASDATGSSASQEASAQPKNGSSSDASASQGQGGGESTTAPSDGGGAANAGNHRTITGKLSYLAPGKLTVTPEGGGREQAFLISNATQILGAAAICSDDDGSGGASIGDDGYGTAKCSVAELEKSAKTNSVTVRVTMDSKSGGAETVEEKYHP
ncbi:conserved hypothetical protein [Streptomyces himastatinicus ATCC 53653]|uniref:Lipoprotein n=1 Tax=Streptomyces himastatinicus ATCC 53653 TaxID=457427 RepID=D9WW11_9ACTN|nr:hypothetical protein [Streptomyces himastatinicus]EFL24520.1 conserved hypothetical protein [Streptomyces himastatinicus ATCC 53653]